MGSGRARSASTRRANSVVFRVFRPFRRFGATAALIAAIAAGGPVAGCGSSDGGTTADEADASPDADPDVTVADSSDPDVRTDAAADVRPDVMPVGTSYCSKLTPRPRFCDDFEDGDLENGWTSAAVVLGNVAEVDDTSFTSTPFSFHVVAKSTAAAAANNALVRTTGFGAVQRAKLAFSTFLPSVTFTKGVVAIASLDLAQSPAHLFTLYLRDGDINAPTAILEEYTAGVTTRHLLTGPPPAGVWTRVAIDLDLVAGKATVMFDATKALDAATIAAVPGTEATVRIGAIIDGPADAFEARFDDVVVDY